MEKYAKYAVEKGPWNSENTWQLGQVIRSIHLIIQHHVNAVRDGDSEALRMTHSTDENAIFDGN